MLLPSSVPEINTAVSEIHAVYTNTGTSPPGGRWSREQGVCESVMSVRIVPHRPVANTIADVQRGIQWYTIGNVTSKQHLCTLKQMVFTAPSDGNTDRTKSKFNDHPSGHVSDQMARTHLSSDRVKLHWPQWPWCFHSSMKALPLSSEHFKADSQSPSSSDRMKSYLLVVGDARRLSQLKLNATNFNYLWHSYFTPQNNSRCGITSHQLTGYGRWWSVNRMVSACVDEGRWGILTSPTLSVSWWMSVRYSYTPNSWNAWLMY